MKSFFFIISILCASFALFSQNVVKLGYLKTDSNTYVVDSCNNWKYYYNLHNPFEGLENELAQERIMKVIVMGERPDSIAMEVLKPYYIKRSDYSVYIRANYDLKGKMQFFEFGFLASLNIPIQVFEELENRVKKESYLKLDYDPKRTKGVNCIQLVWMY